MSVVGELEGFDAGRGRTHDVDVALEAEELREVVARLRDVVDDQDTDLVGHLGLVLVLRAELVVERSTGAGPGWSIAPVALGW